MIMHTSQIKIQLSSRVRCKVEHAVFIPHSPLLYKSMDIGYERETEKPQFILKVLSVELSKLVKSVIAEK